MSNRKFISVTMLKGYSYPFNFITRRYMKFRRTTDEHQKAL